MAAGAADAVPAEAELVRAFVNTLDVDDGSDALPDAAALTRWLRGQGLLGSRATADEDDLRVALLLRSGLRAALAAHHAGDPDAPIAELEQVSALLPLRVAFVGATPTLVPADAGARAGLERVLAAVMACEAAGTWSRLKLCPADDCQWAFYDASKSRTRVWCAMGVCGNRTKTRAYRARHRAGAS